MKKFLLTFLLVVISILGYAQSNLGPSSGFFANKDVGSFSNAVNTIDYNMLTFFDKSRVFNNKLDDSQRKGSYFLFSKWKNTAEIVINEKKYTLENINYDIEDDRFISKMGGDSIVVFDSNYLDKVRINGRKFEYIYNSSIGKKKNLEVIYDNDKGFKVVKEYSLKVILADPNPMVNRPLDEIKQRAKYYTLRGSEIKHLKLQKKTILNLIEKDKQNLVKEFANSKGLSYKKDKDIVRILNYYASL